MDDMGQCTKYYPKQFRQDTEMNVGGYPAYRRRELFPKRGTNGETQLVPRSVPGLNASETCCEYICRAI